MTWTYNLGATLTDRDKIRFLIGDTDNTAQILQDEEIAYALTERPDIRLAAAYCARSIGAKFATLVSKTVGDLTIAYAQRQTHYTDLAKRLEMDGAMTAALPYAGGISVADKKTREDDTDRVVPAIKRDIHDNPRTGPRTRERIFDD